MCTFCLGERLRLLEVMGNIISLCVKKNDTDQEHSEQSKKMAKDAVYETIPFEGQKPGTSGTSP